MKPVDHKEQELDEVFDRDLVVTQMNYSIFHIPTAPNPSGGSHWLDSSSDL